MLNKKGVWGTLGKVVIAIAILGFFLGINEISDIVPQINIFPDNIPNNITIPQKIEPFDFSKTTIIGPKPIKQNMYSNSNNIICYGFENPTAEIGENFTLIGEWFTDNSIIPIKPEYEITLNYSEVINQGRLNWIFINDSNKVRFRTALKLYLAPIFKEVNYDLINNKELEDYLKKDEVISWEDSIIREFTKETSICSNTNDEELAKQLLDFVRSYMVPPAKTENEIYYDNITLNSIESWNNKIGTSSEYSVVYAMLLRSIGIPARILSNPGDNFDYYFVDAYLNDVEWVPIDVYDNNKEIGDLFEKEILELRKNYHYIAIKGLENITFVSLDTTNIPYNAWISLKVTIKSNFNHKIETLKVNITSFNENNQLLRSDWIPLIGQEGLEPNNQTQVELNTFPENINDVKYIKILKIE